MAGTFAGASRALLASVVFAFETTQQPFGLLPLLAGGSASFLIASYLMRNRIMTEKIARRGVVVPGEYAPDRLADAQVSRYHSRGAITLGAQDTVEAVLRKFNANAPGYMHQGFPVLDAKGIILGMITRRDLLAAASSPHVHLSELMRRPPITVQSDQTLRDAADLMAAHDIGRLIVVDSDGHLKGVITRSDLLRALREHGAKRTDHA